MVGVLCGVRGGAVGGRRGRRGGIRWRWGLLRPNENRAAEERQQRKKPHWRKNAAISLKRKRDVHCELDVHAPGRDARRRRQTANQLFVLFLIIVLVIVLIIFVEEVAILRSGAFGHLFFFLVIIVGDAV